MTAPLPAFHLRSADERRAWLQGWLSCWEHIAKELDIGGKLTPAAGNALATAFRQQLEELDTEEQQ